MNWIELLIEFQSAIATLAVGILGFIGVMISIRANGRQSRRQHELELRVRREAVRSIAISELKFFLERVKLLRKGEKLPDNALVHHPLIRRPVSPSLSQDFGLLGEDELSVVMDALLAIDDTNTALIVLADEVYDSHVVLGANRTKLSEYLEGSEKGIETALHAMHRKAE